MKNGRRPVWSVRHQKFAYTFNSQLWICDTKGNKAPIIKDPTSLSANIKDTVVRWANDGQQMVMEIYSSAPA